MHELLDCKDWIRPSEAAVWLFPALWFLLQVFSWLTALFKEWLGVPGVEGKNFKGMI